MPPLETPKINTSLKAKDFNLVSVNGKNYSLNDVEKSNGLVIAFLCNHCPYVQAIAGKIARDANDLAKLNIGFVGINSNDVIAYPDDSYENMKIFAKENNWNFPYLFDETQEIARAYDAVCTPDFFCFDRNLQLKYRGRLDSAGKSSDPDAKRELFIAMQAIANDESISAIKQYPSIGCSIKWKI